MSGKNNSLKRLLFPLTKYNICGGFLIFQRLDIDNNKLNTSSRRIEWMKKLFSREIVRTLKNLII